MQQLAIIYESGTDLVALELVAGKVAIKTRWEWREISRAVNAAAIALRPHRPIYVCTIRDWAPPLPI